MASNVGITQRPWLQIIQLRLMGDGANQTESKHICTYVTPHMAVCLMENGIIGGT